MAWCPGEQFLADGVLWYKSRFAKESLVRLSLLFQGPTIWYWHFPESALPDRWESPVVLKHPPGFHLPRTSKVEWFLSEAKRALESWAGKSDVIAKAPLITVALFREAKAASSSKDPRNCAHTPLNPRFRRILLFMYCSTAASSSAPWLALLTLFMIILLSSAQ